MYINLNEHKYEDISRIKASNGDLFFRGASLKGLTNIDGPITTYRNDGFEMYSDDPADYEDTIIADGVIRLTNNPPAPIGIWDELAQAIKSGVNDVE